MRKASMNFKSGALYTKDGRKLADIDSGIVEWGVQVTAEVPTKSVSQKRQMERKRSCSRPDHKLQPENRQKTAGRPARAPSPCNV